MLLFFLKINCSDAHASRLYLFFSTLVDFSPADMVSAAPTLKHPIVLVHGFSDNPELFRHWAELTKAFQDHGIECLLVKLPPYGSLKERSDALVAQVRGTYRGKSVHLISHSMGGLNARDIASEDPEWLGFHVLTVTTFGTPHHDFKPLELLFNSKLAPYTSEFLDWTKDHVGSWAQSDLGGMKSMTIEETKKLNEKITKSKYAHDNIQYFSWAGQVSRFTISPFMLFQPLISGFGENDGLISVESARCPDGNFLGTLVGVDHIALMAPAYVLPTLQYLEAVESGTTIEVSKVKNDVITVVGRSLTGVVFWVDFPRELLSGLRRRRSVAS